MKLLKLIFLISFVFTSAVAVAGPPAFYLQGQLIRSDGTAVEAPVVNFTLQLLSTNDECLLLEETFVLNMTGTSGIFNLSLGNGTNTGAGGVVDVTQAINNSLGNLIGLTCTNGSTYDPANGDTRKLRVTFDEGTGPVTLAEDHILQSVPYAMYAGTLGGKEANEFIQVNSSSAGVTQTNLETIFDNSTNYAELSALIAGTSSSYAQIGASGAGSLPAFTNGAPPTSPVAGDIWYNSDNGEIQFFDGASTQTVGLGSGTVTSVVTGSGLTGGPITGTGTISVATGGISNAHLASGIDAAKITVGTLPVGVVPSGTDSSKLPLAGGTMTGNIDLDGNHVLNTGYITMNPESPLHLGSFTDSEQGDLLLTFTVPADHAGKIWFNTDDSSFKYWDGAQVVDLQTESNEKLPLAGGTMSGAINMNGENISNTGWVTMMPERSLHLGNFTGAQELIHTGALGAVNVGQLWYNSDSEQIKLWTDDTTALVIAGLGNQSGYAMAADSVPNCTSAQKLSMSAGPTYAWSCVADAGDISAINTNVGSGLSGGSGSGDVTLQVVVDDSTIEIATNTIQLKDGGVTAAKLSTDSVTTVKIADGNVTVAKLATDSVATAKIVDANVTAAKLATDSVSTVKIVDANVTAAKLATDSVSTAKIVDANVTTDKLADGSVTDAKIGTVGVDKIISGATKYFTYQPANTACANNEVLKWDNTNSRWVCGADNNVADHGSLSGLGDDDHTQYVMLVGRSGGQYVTGGTGAGDDLTLESTSNATKGYVIINPDGGNVGIGDETPDTKLGIAGRITSGPKGLAAGDGGSIIFEELAANGTNFVGLRAPDAVTSDLVFELPNSYGSSGEVLQTNGSGILSWTAVGGGDITEVTTNATTSGLTGGNTTGAVALTVDVDDSSIEISGTNKVQVKDAGVTAAKLATDSVSTLKIVDANVTAAKLATDSVSTAKIVDANVTAAKLATDSVSTAKIVDANVTTDKLADGSVTDAKIGTVSVDKIINGATKYFTYQPANTACANNEVLKWDNTNSRWICGADNNVSDHGAIGGLSDDDHTQYVLLAGRSTGQTITGGTAANDDLILQSTSHATKGDVLLQTNGGRVGVGTSSPDGSLHIDSSEDIFIQTDSATALSSMDLHFRRSRASGLVSDGDRLGAIYFQGHNGTSYTLGAGNNRQAFIRVAMDGAATGVSLPTEIEFGTTTAGSTGASTKMIIKSDGSVGIGTDEPTAALEVDSTDEAWGEGIVLNPSPSDYSGVWFRNTAGSTTNTWGLTKGSGDHLVIKREGLTGMLGTNNPHTAFDIDTNGDINVGRNFGVKTSSVLSSALTVGGDIRSEPKGTSSGDGGTIFMQELATNGVQYTGFRAPDALTSNIILELPATVGTSGQVLETDGSGVLSWVTKSTGASSIDELSDAISDNTSNNLMLGDGTGAAITSGTANVGVGHNNLASLSSGTGNIAIGETALNAISTTSGNIGIGRNAYYGGVGDNVVAIGGGALSNNSGTPHGSGNTAVGSGAANGSAVTDVFVDSTIVGYGAGNNAGGTNVTAMGRGAFSQSDGLYNSAFGTYSGMRVNGSSNVFLGSSAGGSPGANSTYSNSVHIGSGAAGQNIAKTGGNNVSIGYNSNHSLTSGANNIALGYSSADNITTGSNNITIGYDIDVASATGNHQLNIGNAITGDLSTGDVTIDNELRLSDSDDSNYVGFRSPAAVATNVVWSLPNTDGTSNQVMQTNGSGVLSWVDLPGGGSSALNDLSDAVADTTDFNLGLGERAMDSITSGSENIGVGERAGDDISSGDSNIAIGYRAMDGNTTSSDNVAIGTQSLFGTTVGDENVGIGTDTLFNNVGSTGSFNTAIGHSAFKSAPGSSNAIVGNDAGFSSGASYSVALGARSLYSSDSSDAVAIGYQAAENADGNGLIAIGRETYRRNTGSVTGLRNIGIGYEAASNSSVDSSGNDNIAIGFNSHDILTSGSNNIALGALAADNLTTGSNNITIGYDVDVASATGDNQLNIGNAITGDLSTGDIAIDNELRVNDSDDSNYVGFKSPATVATNQIWTLPDADGTSGQLLQTNGSGVLGWVAAGGDFADGGNTATTTKVLGTNNTHDLEFETDGSTRMHLYSDGRFKFGSAGMPSDTNMFFDIDAMDAYIGRAVEFGGYLTSTTQTQFHTLFTPIISPSGASTRNYTAVGVHPNYSTSNAVTSSDYTAFEINQSVSSSAAIDEVYGLRVYQRMFNSSSVDNLYGAYFEDPYTASGAASIGNNFYSIYIEASPGIASGETYALYTSDEAQSYHRGNFGLRDATPDAYLEIANEGTAAPYLMLSSDDYRDGDVFMVENDGDVGIGDKTPSYKLDVNGDLQVQGSSTTCVLGNGSGATNCTSDIRLKSDIAPIENALDKILSLNGINFVWNEKSQSPGTKAMGVIAQEVEKQFPTTVIENVGTGYKMVDYAALVAPLIQATKEQQEIIIENRKYCEVNHDVLKKKLEALQYRGEENSRKIASVEDENKKLKIENEILKQKLDQVINKNNKMQSDIDEIRSMLLKINQK